MSTNFIDSTSTNSRSYFYAVLSTNADFESVQSTSILAAPLLAIDVIAGGESLDLWLSWPEWAADYAAYRATSLTPPVTWELVTKSPQDSNGMFEAQVPAIKSSSQFFRLTRP
ncbi:MAG: hypothetical protein EXS36_16355 [Pedosphaera sp.]|nr:hypothetical protein [Pedosphaera sp.]